MPPPDPSTSTSQPAWRSWHIVVGIACIVVIIAGIRVIAPLVNSLLLAIVLSLMITPILDWFIRHGLPRGLAIAATVIFVIVVGLGLIYVLGTTLARLASQLQDYEENIHDLMESGRKVLKGWNIDLSAVASGDILDSSRLMGTARWLLGSVGQLLGGAMLQLLLVVFILIEAPSLQARLSKGTRETRVATHFTQIMGDIRRYISVVGWLGVLMAVPTTIFLLAMGVEGALLWGALAFLLSFVPAVGFLLSLVPPVLWTLLQHDDWKRALIVAVGMILINSFVDNVIRPRLIGRHLSISPLAIILSLLFWNFVLGPMGALMAIPLTVALKKALLDRFEETRILAKLIEGGGGEAPTPTPETTPSPPSRSS